MRAYVQNTFQLVWSTERREPVLDSAGSRRLYPYILKLLENKRSKGFAIGGVEDHLHLICFSHQSIAVADLIKDIKLATHDMIVADPTLFPLFRGWQRGYAAISYGIEARQDLINYANRQRTHHADTQSYRDELRQLLLDNLVDFSEEHFDKDINE